MTANEYVRQGNEPKLYQMKSGGPGSATLKWIPKGNNLERKEHLPSLTLSDL